MNGIGLLITILFCSIVYWGTSRYYIRMVKDINAAWERNFDLLRQNLENK